MSRATVSNWIRSYRKECKTMVKRSPGWSLWKNFVISGGGKAELEKENSFLKNSGVLGEGNRLVAYCIFELLEVRRLYDSLYCKKETRLIMDIIGVVLEKMVEITVDTFWKPLNKFFERKLKERNNVCLVITGQNNEKPFSIDLKKSSRIDFQEWYEKLCRKGDVEVKFEYLDEAKKSIGGLDRSDDKYEESCKMIYDYMRGIEGKGEVIKIVIKNSVLERCISDNIKNFSAFVIAVIDKVFRHVRGDNTFNPSELVKLDVYERPGKDYFSFYIPLDEYNRVSEKSEGKIEVPYMVYLDEVLNYFSDSTIMSREILPEYLIYNAFKERDKGHKITLKNISLWHISRG